MVRQLFRKHLGKQRCSLRCSLLNLSTTLGFLSRQGLRLESEEGLFFALLRDLQPGQFRLPFADLPVPSCRRAERTRRSSSTAGGNPAVSQACNSRLKLQHVAEDVKESTGRTAPIRYRRRFCQPRSRRPKTRLGSPAIYSKGYLDRDEGYSHRPKISTSTQWRRMVREAFTGTSLHRGGGCVALPGIRGESLRRF